MHSPRKLRLLHLWLSLSSSFWALLPQFHLVYSSSNRYTLLWSRSYHAAILAAVLSLAGLFFVARQICRWLSHKSRLLKWVDLLPLIWLNYIAWRTLFALLIHVEALPPAMIRMLWSPILKLCAYVLIPIPLIFRFPTQATRWLKRQYLGLSILLAFFLLHSPTWRTFEQYDAFLSPDLLATKSATGQNVVIFLMDEWSFPRTFEAPGWENRWPALAGLLSESTLYSRAYTLGAETRLSVPRLLFSNDPDFSRQSYDEVLNFNEKGIPHQGASLFKLAPTNWLTTAVGFTINYPVILKDHVDLALRFESENVRRTFKGEFRHLMLSQMAFLRLLGIHFDYVIDPDWYPQMEVHEYAMELLENQTCDLFAYFHYGWPHYPYIWTRSGRKEAAISASEAKDHTLENYMDNLDYMDVVIGEICDALKNSKRWDHSLIIFTSDHGWRFDPVLPKSWSNLEEPDPFSPWKHTPLIIKYPNQTSSHVEAAHPVTHGNLQHLIHAYAKGEILSPTNDWLRMPSPSP